MKKKLEAELISIAHRILQLKDKTTVHQLKEESRQLYEKLTILSFSESHFAGPQPTIGQIKTALDVDETHELKEVKQEIKTIVDPTPIKKIEQQAEEKVIVDPILPPVEKVEEQTEKLSTTSNKEENQDITTTTTESKPEIIIEEINARVTEDLFVPASTAQEEVVSFSDAIPSSSSYEKNDLENVTPTAQDISTNKTDIDDRPKSLNDQLRKDIHIGLNDRLAFIKYLFEGNASDYNRVLSQLNTFRDKKEAEDFVSTMIKPDYNNWQGKEEYEERFMDIVLSKFDQ